MAKIDGDITGKASRHGHERCDECGGDLHTCLLCYEESEVDENLAEMPTACRAERFLCYECRILHGMECLECKVADIDADADDLWPASDRDF